MRPGILLSALLFAAVASAGEDPRVKLLNKQLQSAKDPRVRAQACQVLGKTGSPDAVLPLCGALSDNEPIVRIAASNALATLGSGDGLNCLKSAKDDPDSSVRRSIDVAIAALKPSGGLYVSVAPIQSDVSSLPADMVNLARELIKKQIIALGATLGPDDETEAQATSVVNKKGYKGYLLKATLKSNGSSGLKVEVLVMTWPAKALQGTWNVKASGGKPEAQLKALVPKLVGDVSADLDWQ